MVWDVDLIIYEIEIYVVLFREKIKSKLYIFQWNASFFTKNWKQIYI